MSPNERIQGKILTWNLAISFSTLCWALTTGTLQCSTQLLISSCLLLWSKHSYAHLKYTCCKIVSILKSTWEKIQEKKIRRKRNSSFAGVGKTTTAYHTTSDEMIQASEKNWVSEICPMFKKVTNLVVSPEIKNGPTTKPQLNCNSYPFQRKVKEPKLNNYYMK